jgi:NADP-dependent 3-hydroxy acid dehydrogenase YdfG
VFIADATDPTLAGGVIDSRDPDILAVVAGAAPLLHPIHHHTWETFSLNWNVDVRVTFNWLREALLKPLRPGSRVLLMSSAAVLHGSPTSGGYAGAKAAIKYMAAYADGVPSGRPRDSRGRGAAETDARDGSRRRDGQGVRRS